MKNETTQQELFKEFGELKQKEKKTYSILPKNYTLFSVSYEQTIFIAIAVIMLMVLVFSLGVERGKRLSGASFKIAEIKDVQKDIQVESPKIELPEVSEVETVMPQQEEKKEEKKVVNSKLFTIQVIAYRSKKSAQEELVRVNKKGFAPFIIVGGGYYQICVGEYANQKEADNDLLELRKTYKDSFLRKR